MLLGLTLPQMHEIATSSVFLTQVFSQKNESSSQPWGGVNLLHKLAPPTARAGAGAGGHGQSQGKQRDMASLYYYITSPSNEKLDLSRVQMAPTRPSACPPGLASCCLAGLQRLGGGSR